MPGSTYHTFKKPEISRLFKQARRIYKSNELDVLAIPRAKDYARLLIITPKKIGNAPVRNKIKRRIRAIFYENSLYQNNHDLIVIIKKDGTLLSFSDLSTIIIACSNHEKKE